MSWPMVALGEVAEINPRIPKSVREAPDETISFVPMASVSEQGHVVASEPRPAVEVLKGYTFFQRGDVLVAKITPCYENNKTAIAEIDTRYGFGTTEFHVLRADERQLDPAYLHHFIRTDRVRSQGAKRMTGSGGQRRVPKAYFETLEIPLPPLDEQKWIAAILDKADALRRAQRKAADLLNGLAVSRFRALFGDPSSNAQRYPLRAFGEIFRDETSKSPKVQRGDYKASGRFPVVDQGKSLVAGWVEDERHLNGSALPVVIFGDHTRAVKFVDFEFCTGADGAKVLAVQEGWDARYAATLLSLMPIPNLGYSRHMREVKRLQFPQPPLRDQQYFGVFYSGVMERGAVFESRESRLNALFNSLQHRAFAGEL